MSRVPQASSSTAFKRNLAAHLQGAAEDRLPSRPMTIQDLLRHTSRLTYGDTTPNARVKRPTVRSASTART
jgi:hypothetical protein